MAPVTPQRISAAVDRVLQSIYKVRELAIIDSWGLTPDRSRNPLTAHPRRYFSQTDEDGILEQILSRIGMNTEGVFVEYGVGDGTVCNTVALLARGWKGVWISNEDLIFTPRPGGRLVYQQAWVTLGDIVRLTVNGLARLRSSDKAVGLEDVDVVSFDLDGNDYHFSKALLEAGLRPRAWIAEYNAKFPVGVSWVMKQDDAHTWKLDDYYGASISAFASLFEDHGYFPVACSAQGASVFFVRNEYSSMFDDVPRDLAVIYQPPLPGSTRWGHPVSRRTLESLT